MPERESSSGLSSSEPKTRGPVLLTFGADPVLSGVEVVEYRLNVDGGVPQHEDIQSYTASAKYRLSEHHGTPLAQDGSLSVLAIRRLSQSVEGRNDRTITPEKVGERTLSARDPADRADLIELIKSDLRRAIPSDRYESRFLNEITAREPAWTAESGKYAAHHKFQCSVDLTRAGEPLLHVEVGHTKQALTTIDSRFEEGESLPRMKVKHDPDQYETPGNGTLTGWSEYHYTDYVPGLGDSIAGSHEGDLKESRRQELIDRNPRLVTVDYGSWTGHQLPQILVPVERPEEVRQDDPEFYKRFDYESNLLPGERYRLAAGFVEDLARLPTLELSFSPDLSTGEYQQVAYRTQHEPRLVFGGGARSTQPVDALRQEGVYKSPGEYRVGVVTPTSAPYKSIRDELPPLIARRLREIGAPAGVRASVSYEPGSVANYTEAASQVSDEMDVVVAVVPDPQKMRGLGIEDPFNELKRRLMRAGIPTQMVRRDTAEQWLKTSATPSSNSLANTLSAIVAKAGGTPWRIAEMPGDTDAFIGLDVTRKNDKTAGASASVVLPDGATFAAESTTFQDGEQFDAEDVTQIIRDLVFDFDGVRDVSLDHLTLLRDGKIPEDVPAIRNGLADVDVTLDVAGIRKSGQPRIGHYDPHGYQTEDGWRVADKGVAFVDEARDRAILHSWGVPDCGPQNTNGTPRPLGVRKHSGPTTLETLTEQVYWLSEIHYGSPARSPTNPVPIDYADKAAEYVREGYADPDSVVDGPAYL